MTTQTTRPFRRAARQAAQAPYNHIPVETVPGDSAPAVQGESSPNAYRRAWGRPVYHRSTLRVVVGESWAPSAN